MEAVMHPRPFLVALLAAAWAAAPAAAQADRVFLRPEPGGRMGVLTAVAFSPDGERLYAAGFDKRAARARLRRPHGPADRRPARRFLRLRLGVARRRLRRLG